VRASCDYLPIGVPKRQPPTVFTLRNTTDHFLIVRVPGKSEWNRHFGGGVVPTNCDVSPFAEDDNAGNRNAENAVFAFVAIKFSDVAIAKAAHGWLLEANDIYAKGKKGKLASVRMEMILRAIQSSVTGEPVTKDIMDEVLLSYHAKPKAAGKATEKRGRKRNDDKDDEDDEYVPPTTQVPRKITKRSAVSTPQRLVSEFSLAEDDDDDGNTRPMDEAEKEDDDDSSRPSEGMDIEYGLPNPLHAPGPAPLHASGPAGPCFGQSPMSDAPLADPNEMMARTAIEIQIQEMEQSTLSPQKRLIF